MEKIIVIDNKEVLFRATAATPLHYRNMFGRDLMLDIKALANAMEKEEYDIASLEVFEKVAYIMARSGAFNSPDFPKTPIDWLDQFSLFSIYEILPQIIELWGINTKTLSSSKKKLKQ